MRSYTWVVAQLFMDRPEVLGSAKHYSDFIVHWTVQLDYSWWESSCIIKFQASQWSANTLQYLNYSNTSCTGSQQCLTPPALMDRCWETKHERGRMMKTLRACEYCTLLTPRIVCLCSTTQHQHTVPRRENVLRNSKITILSNASVGCYKASAGFYSGVCSSIIGSREK